MAAVREVEQDANLKRAFLGADNESGGNISVSELKEGLRAVDVDFDGEDGDKFFAGMSDLNSRVLSFDKLKHHLAQRMFYRCKLNGTMSCSHCSKLNEMRAAMHQQSALLLIPGNDTVVALRTEKAMLDATHGYELAQSFQRSTQEHAIDSLIVR